MYFQTGFILLLYRGKWMNSNAIAMIINTSLILGDHSTPMGWWSFIAIYSTCSNLNIDDASLTHRFSALHWKDKQKFVGGQQQLRTNRDNPKSNNFRLLLKESSRLRAKKLAHKWSLWGLQRSCVTTCPIGRHRSYWRENSIPDRKGHGANIGLIWGRHDPGGPHVGQMKFAILDSGHSFTILLKIYICGIIGMYGYGNRRKTYVMKHQTDWHFIAKNKYGVAVGFSLLNIHGQHDIGTFSTIQYLWLSW